MLCYAIACYALARRCPVVTGYAVAFARRCPVLTGAMLLPGGNEAQVHRVQGQVSLPQPRNQTRESHLFGGRVHQRRGISLAISRRV
eukprot:3802905-Rhodomonas_salina.1